MKRLLKLLLAIVMVLFVTGCNTSNSGIIGAEKYVTFSYNDSVASDYKCKIKDSKINCVVIEPENDELVFMGWYDESDNKVDIEGSFKESVVLHPKFLNEEEIKHEKLSAAKYTITFNMNGGSGSIDKLEVEYEGQLPKLNSIPSRDGYIFVGFFDKPDYTKGKRYYDEKGESIRNFDKVNNTTMYAGWEKKNSDPSSSIKSSSTSQKSSSSIKSSSSSLVKPSSSSVRPSSSSAKPSSSSARPSSSQTVISYTVTFNMNGGTGGQTAVQATYGKAMPAIISTNPTRTGYTFTGWYDNNGTQYYTQDNNSARAYDKTSATMLYAGWKANTFTVAYNGNGNTGGSIANQTCTYDSDCILKSNVYTKTGYIFTGWKKNNSGNIVAASSNVKNATASGTVTYYAQWTAAAYKVSFSLNGGTGTTPGAINATYGQALSKINISTPIRTGYTFMGWYDNSNYANGTQYYRVDGTSVRNYDKYSDTTLYAGWKVNTYTVSFNLNGGAGILPGNVTVTYNSNMPKITVTTPTNSGYEFKGWYDNADWTIGKLYYNPDGSSARPYDKTSNTTLYAGWKKIEKLKIYYLSIGRYDGFLIQGNGTTAFIDGGYPSEGKKCIEFLKEMGVTKIDALIGSHLHNNHIDAHKNIIDAFEIGHAYYNDDPGTCKKRRTCSENAASPSALNKKLNEKGIPITILTPGFNVKIGNLVFDILQPMSLHDSPNGNSLHMILKYGNQKFYFTGDGCSRVVDEVYNTYDHSVFSNISIYKHPHHGECELPEDYINVMSPKYVIVPSTKKAKAEHAYDKVGSTVYELGRKLVDTKNIIGAGDSLRGYVLAETDGYSLQVIDRRQ